MTAPRKNRSRRGRKRSGASKPADLWRPVPPLAPPEPVVAASDPTAVLRSLGDPPLHGQRGAEHYVAAVVERAAGLAAALAASADLLAERPDDADEAPATR